jgi:hypothetical protein
MQIAFSFAPLMALWRLWSAARQRRFVSDPEEIK